MTYSPWSNGLQPKKLYVCHQFLSRFLFNGHLPWVSRQLCLLANDKNDSGVKLGLYPDLLAFTLQLRKILSRRLSDEDYSTSCCLKWGPLPLIDVGRITQHVRVGERSKGRYGVNEHNNAIQPMLIENYNRHMRYVNKSDRMINDYSISWHTFKNFPHLLDLAILTVCWANYSHQEFWLFSVINLVEEPHPFKEKGKPRYKQHWSHRITVNEHWSKKGNMLHLFCFGKHPTD